MDTELRQYCFEELKGVHASPTVVFVQLMVTPESEKARHRA
jgi:hypothetical protein